MTSLLHQGAGKELTDALVVLGPSDKARSDRDAMRVLCIELRSLQEQLHILDGEEMPEDGKALELKSKLKVCLRALAMACIIDQIGVFQELSDVQGANRSQPDVQSHEIREYLTDFRGSLHCLSMKIVMPLLC